MTNCLGKLAGFVLVCVVISAVVTTLIGSVHFHLPLALASASSSRLAAQHAASDDLLHASTVSTQFIDKVLCKAHSPACGTGLWMFRYGQRYGIDPAYALAFFKHESNFGLLGIARETRSLGNIRCTRGYQCIAGYRAYPSWVGGYLDWYNLIYYYYIKQLHRHTLSAILPLYAPASDRNNVTAYVTAVTQAVAQWRKASV